VLLSIGASYTRVEASEAEADWLHSYLSVEDVDYEHKARAVAERVRQAYVARGYDLDDPEQAAMYLASVQAQLPDKRLRLYNRTHGVFLTGLLALVRARAPERGFGVQEVDLRKFRPLDRGELDFAALAREPMTLREYQVDAVIAALTTPAGVVEPGCPEWAVSNSDAGRSIIHVPTGGGKSRMAVGIAHTVTHVRQGDELVAAKWLFLVHRNHLAADVAERWDSTAGQVEGCAAGCIGAGGDWSEGERFTVATLQTLYAAMGTDRFRRLVESVHGVIVDECHVAPARTFLKVIASFNSAAYKIGLSGTPLARGDKRNLVAIGALGPVAYRIRADELIERGYLSKPTIRLIPLHQELQHGETITDAYDELVLHSTHRNAAIAKCALICEKPAMVFVEREIHGKQLEKFLLSQGLNVRFVYGKTPKRERQRAIQDLQAGYLDVVVASTVFNDGVDITSLRSCVMGAAGRSEIAALQRVGRSLRVEPGKSEATIYDIGDKGYFNLNDQAHDRLRAYQREGYQIVVDRDIWPEVANPRLELHKSWAAMFR